MRTDDLIERLSNHPPDENINAAIELIEAQRQTIANLRGQLSSMQRSHAMTTLRLEQYKDANNTGSNASSAVRTTA